MSLRIKFSDLLTFLSFKSSSNNLIRVVFSFDSQYGEMSFKDGEIWEIIFSDMEMEEAINFLHNRKIEVREIRELLHNDTIKILSDLISGFATEYLIYHAHKGELTWEVSSEELKDLYIKSKQKILENLKNKADMVWLEKDKTSGIYALKLKDELVVFAFFNAATRREFFNTTSPFLRELSKITLECSVE